MTLIIAALHSELAALIQRMDAPRIWQRSISGTNADIMAYVKAYSPLGLPILCVSCGIGQQSMTLAIDYLRKLYTLQAAVVVGTAGALDSALPVGTIICPQEVVYMGGGRKKDLHTLSIPNQASAIFPAGAGGIPQQTGTLLTSDTEVLSNSKRNRLRNASGGAVAVDMESYAAIRILQKHSIPCMVMRVIIDTHGAPLSDTQQHGSLTTRVSSASMALADILHPALTGR